MTFLRPITSALLIAGLLRLTHSHPVADNPNPHPSDPSQKPNLSLLPSQDLSPSDGWADPIWEIPVSDGPKIQFYNGGPCDNNKTVEEHTFSNGTVANATLISVFEDYNEAFKSEAGRSKAIEQLQTNFQELAKWQQLPAQQSNDGKRLLKSRSITTAAFISSSSSASETSSLSLIRRQDQDQNPPAYLSTALRIARKVTLVTAFVASGTAIGLVFGQILAEQVADRGSSLNRDQSSLIKGAIMICFGAISGLLYSFLVDHTAEMRADAAAAFAVLGSALGRALRELGGRMLPQQQQQQPEAPDPVLVQQTLQDIETGQVGAAELQPHLPQGVSTGGGGAQQIVREVEMTREACPVNPGSNANAAADVPGASYRSWQVANTLQGLPSES